MPRLFCLKALLVVLCISSMALPLLAQVRVRGYFRKDGTYVAPHYRSSPDKSPYNNYGMPGNYNPNTGDITQGDMLKYLERYYSKPTPSVSTYALRSASKTPDRDPLPSVAEFPRASDPVPDEELARSRNYCSMLYVESTSCNECLEQQQEALSALMLPDYRELPASEVARSIKYCEWLYGDNRAGCYNCLNRQLLGLRKPPPEFSASTSPTDEQRAKSYCEWLYGNDRAGYYACIGRQVSSLAREVGDVSRLPADEWQRSVQYCEWLYSNNRGGCNECLARQAESLRKHNSKGMFSAAVPAEARSYCEWLYNNNRAGYWDCVARKLQ